MPLECFIDRESLNTKGKTTSIFNSKTICCHCYYLYSFAAIEPHRREKCGLKWQADNFRNGLSSFPYLFPCVYPVDTLFSLVYRWYWHATGHSSYLRISCIYIYIYGCFVQWLLACRLSSRWSWKRNGWVEKNRESIYPRNFLGYYGRLHMRDWQRTYNRVWEDVLIQYVYADANKICRCHQFKVYQRKITLDH